MSESPFQLLTDLSPQSQLESRCLELSRSSSIKEGDKFVGELVPGDFEEYLLIFHALFENLHDGVPNRVKWRDLCEELQIPFSPACSPFAVEITILDHCLTNRKFFAVEDESLDNEMVVDLWKEVVKHERDQDCYLFYDGPAWTDYERKLYRHMLHSSPPIPAEVSFPPHYWYPKSQKWCLSSPPCRGQSIFAGPKDLVGTIKNIPSLECLPVGIDTILPVARDLLRV